MKKPGQQPTILMIKCHLAKTVGEISLQRLVHYMGSFPERFVLTGVGAMATVREVGGADNADAVAATTAARDAERGLASRGVWNPDRRSSSQWMILFFKN